MCFDHIHSPSFPLLFTEQNLPSYLTLLHAFSSFRRNYLTAKLRFICSSVLPACTCVYQVCVLCPHRSEGSGSSGCGVIDDWELLSGFWERSLNYWHMSPTPTKFSFYNSLSLLKFYKFECMLLIFLLWLRIVWVMAKEPEKRVTMKGI